MSLRLAESGRRMHCSNHGVRLSVVLYSLAGPRKIVTWKLVSEKRCTPSCISQEIILPLKSSLQIRSVHLLPSSKVGLSFRVRLSRNNLEISRATDIFFFNEPSVCSAELENVLLALLHNLVFLSENGKDVLTRTAFQRKSLAPVLHRIHIVLQDPLAEFGVVQVPGLLGSRDEQA
mmetsp:Transcript_53089/g.140076  ORF Transcript_53089/g.140076 Transcript_53089/m.140076 type:complete len:176 (+) Transcript_53089:1013-1540(+)